MQYYYHEMLTNLDDTGFGVIYIDRPNAYSPPHWHSAVEVLLFLRGSATCKFSHSTLKLEQGDVCLINSHDIHETRCSHDARYLVLHILPGAMGRYVPDFDQLTFSLKFDPDDPVKSGALDEIRQHITAIGDLRTREESGAALELHARLFALTAILVRQFSRPIAQEDSNRQRSDMTRLEPLLDFTQLHHHEDLTLDQAAESMGLNREYFCRLFKKNMGVSYLTYLNQIRATAVCRELETSDDPISVIAERHGFTSPKMLNQYFRELYGCTPSEKRKAFREMILDGVY